jgi:hypothetical protein
MVNLKRKHLAAIYPEFKSDNFDNFEDYEIEWTNIYNKERVKNQYQEGKTNNGNISPPPKIIEIWYKINEYIGNKLKDNNNISSPSQIIENSNLVEVNNKLNISSFSGSSSSSSGSSSSFSPSSSSSSSFISSFGFSSDFIPFNSLKSSDLRSSPGVSAVVDLDSNNEDAIDRLLKIRDNIPMHRDENSVMYALLSQINPQIYGNRTLAQTLDSYFILRDTRLQLYLQQFRNIYVQNRNIYSLEDGLHIGRK